MEKVVESEFIYTRMTTGGDVITQVGGLCETLARRFLQVKCCLRICPE